MRKFWVFVGRVVGKISSIYRHQIFLAKADNLSGDVRVLGSVDFRATNVKIGKNVTLYPGVMFWGDGEIVIGDNVDIGKDTIIFSKESVRIGNDVAIAAQCYIIDSNHGMDTGTLIRKQPLQTQGITIGNDVWISAGVKVLKGARIHDGAVIGAMSLVNSEISENAIAFGIPARTSSHRQ